jgi:hypothetical protein
LLGKIQIATLETTQKRLPEAQTRIPAGLSVRRMTELPRASRAGGPDFFRKKVRAFQIATDSLA